MKELIYQLLILVFAGGFIALHVAVLIVLVGAVVEFLTKK